MVGGAGETFSSADLRSRDKIVAQRHQKELDNLERKLARSKATNDDLMKQLFDAQHRGNRLATSLGFSGLNEAQVYIDNCDDDTSYKDRSQRITELQRELATYKKDQGVLTVDSERSKEATLALKDEIDGLHHQLADSGGEIDVLNVRIKAYELKLLELESLQKRYDDLVVSMKRASERYSQDYRSIKKMQRWLSCTDLKTGDAAVDSSLNTMKQARLKGFSQADVEKILKLLKEGIQPAALDELLGIQLPVQYSRVTRGLPKVPTCATTASSASSDTRVGSPQLPVKVHPSSPSPRADCLPPSSDTESDSQAIEPFQRSLFDRRSSGRLHAVPAGPSSDTEDDSQMPSMASLSPAPSRVETPRVSNRPIVPRTLPLNTRRVQASDFQRRPNTDLPRPSKVRRTNGEDISEQPDSTPLRGKNSGDLPKRLPLQDKALVRETGNTVSAANSRPLAPLFKGKASDNQSTPTSSAPTRNNGTDYSAYKGRGRYAQPVGSAKPINAVFAIDPSRNGGLNFQFEEVVRGKDARQKLHAGDCECCRDYYEAVGPLPARPQPPLWRSPESTPVKQRPRDSKDRHISSENKATIDRHKQAISRHRQIWTRGRTPPGYWNIGFPTTQEVKDINDLAEEMHRRKEEEIEAEARRGDGRYKRRDRDW